MFYYYLLVGIPILIAFFRSKGVVRIGGELENSGKSTEITAFFVVFTLLLMLRGAACGTDTARYLYLHEVLARYDLKMVLTDWSSDEPVYDILSRLISVFSVKKQALLIVTAVLTLTPLLKFYQKEAEQPILTMALFLTVAPFSMYFSGIRQSLAMAFAVPAWYCAKDKRLIRFAAVVLLATQFHKSAFILAVIYPLYHLAIKRRLLIVVLPVMGAIYAFNAPIFNFLAQFLWSDYGTAKETGAYTVLLLLILFAAYSFIIPDEGNMDQDMIALRNLLLFSICIQCFAPVHVLAMRMNYYFLPFIPVLIPKIANRSKRGLRSVANLSVIVMTLFFLVYFFVRAYRGADMLNVFPYVPFWK